MAVLLVTLAQATPVLEAGRPRDDLRRAGIEPAWWVVNQTWSGVATADPVPARQGRAEIPWLGKVAHLAGRAVRLSWRVQAPRGREGLAQLVAAGDSGGRA